ncbi:PLP-dependent aminotransferase family protein [Neobacillus sp. 179-J 1A1 HS]|uniref:aminotransferase-like domain-containing protein n=1 Tax=Neobacillus driksii TaxID=3035913 RepID=UPI0035BBB0DD
MDWKPKRTKELPLYKQILSFLETKIVNGEFPPGSRLPSERELADQLQVNRSTINIVFEELRAAGLVKRKVGVGTIVNGEIWDQNHKRLPNWDKYVEEGYYQSNNPINQRIYRSIRSDDSIINFAIGQLSPDLSPFSLMKNNDILNLNDHLGYEDIQGSLELRETISSHLHNYRKIHSTPSSILITSGAQQAIHIIIRCLLNPGDSVAIEDPSYAYSLPIFHSNGLKTHLLPVANDGIDPEQIITLYKKHRIKMVFLNPVYQNPTGATLSEAKKIRLLEICSQLGIAIVEDDPYSLTGYNNWSCTLKSMDSEGIVLYVSSLSKIIASGLRIGWISGPQSVIDRLTDAKHQIDFGHSIFSQRIATMLLTSQNFDEHISSLKTGLIAKRDLMMDSLKRELKDEISFFSPNGGVHLWCKFNEELSTDHRLFKEALKLKMVFTPGTTLGTQKHHIRLTFSSVDNHLIHEGIQRLAQAYKESKINS